METDHNQQRDSIHPDKNDWDLLVRLNGFLGLVLRNETVEVAVHPARHHASVSALR